MKKLIMQNPHSGIIKRAPVGFSWTTLFFGAFPAFLRGDYKWCFIQFILGAVLILPLLIFPFIYNKLYLKKLLVRGYKVKSVEGTTIEALNQRYELDLPMLPGK